MKFPFVLPLMLLLTTLSGILVHILRYAGLAEWSWDLYAAHMVVVVPMLLIEVPFGKWAHMFYRPLALYFQALKDKALATAGQTQVDQPVRKVA